MGVSEFFVPSPDPKLRGRELKAWIQADIQRHWDAHKAGMSACECVQRIAASRQSILRALFEKAREDVGGNLDLSLVALGGLGRGELAPYSDIDVIVVAKGHRNKALSKIVDAFLYPLWDGGIDVGHAVRTPREFALLAKSDNTVRTGALDCRLISGSEEIFGDLRKRLDKTLSGKRLQGEILSAIGEWMEGSETSTVYRLEPNVKTGPGGLRTLHETWWAARVAWDIREWDELLYGAKVSQHDFEILAGGREFMQSVRLALHVLGGRRQDVLRFDVQNQVADLLQISGEGEARQSGDVLLERYYRQAKQLKAAATRIQERCSQGLQEKLRRSLKKRAVKRVDGFSLWDGRLSHSSADDFRAAPLELLRIFRVAQRHRVRVAPETRMAIAEMVPECFDESVAQSPEAVKLFSDILTDPRGGIACLEALHELGLLERLLPEFSKVVGLVQRDMYHVYTVDAHLIYCAQMILMALSNDPVGIPADIVEAVERVSRPHVLVWGALMHDIGKGYGHGHSARGAAMAEEASRRMLWKREDRIDLSFLVQEHLSMMVISQRRDLEDLDLIHRFAARVETTERLDMLFVLSYADAVTTGPEAFTDWKAALLRELYQRTRIAIHGGAGMEATAKRAAARVADLVQRSGADGTRFRALASEFPHRHLVTHRFELLKRHFRALEEVKERGVSVTVLHEEQGQGWEIVVGCPDHAGLLSDLAGALAANGVSVIGAYTGATLSGYAICTFVVGADDWPAARSPAKTAELCKELEQKALQQGGDYSPQIHARRRSARTFAAGVPISSTRILYDSGATGSSTVLDVFTPDRVGVLHLIAKAIFEEGVMIEQARITTEGERAVDSFYVVDAITKKPLDDRAREKLAQAITRECTDALESLDGK